MVVVPCNSPYTSPEEFTVATLVLLLNQTILLLLAFVGDTVAVRVDDFPPILSASVSDELLTEVSLTGSEYVKLRLSINK